MCGAGSVSGERERGGCGVCGGRSVRGRGEGVECVVGGSVKR